MGIGSKVLTIGRVRNCHDPHLGQIVCDKDGVVGLVHCPGGNATDPIWRVLASSKGIFSWTPLKPQHSNHDPNLLANQVWCINFLTSPTPLIIPYRLPALLESLMLESQKLMLDSCKMLQKQSEAFHTFLWHFSKFKIVLLKCPHVQIAFLKFTSCDNQDLVGCIPIASVAVDLNVKS